MKCILCHSTQLRLLNSLSTEKLITDWYETCQIDIRPELKGYKHIGLYSCLNCSLKFYSPELAGSSTLYAQLQQFKWYYMPHKWEYDVALEDIQPRNRVLEIGCGVGDFVQRLLTDRASEAIGIELNTQAVENAHKLGRPIYHKSVEALAKEQPRSFDVVCSFQVLEHVPNPHEFLTASIDLLKPNGRLLIGVPNSESFIRLERNNILDQPPHHISRWSKTSLEGLVTLFPLQLERVAYEPLASYHVIWYTKLHLKRLLGSQKLYRFALRVVDKLILPTVLRTGWHRFLRGHAIYISFQKRDI